MTSDADADAVRRILQDAEDVDLPDAMAAVAADGDPGPDHLDAFPDDHPDLAAADGQGGAPHPDRADTDFATPDNLRKASTLPINDLGNGQRFVLHFGADVMFVPRVGWHVWDGRVWQVDPDMIATRIGAQRLPELDRKSVV